MSGSMAHGLSRILNRRADPSWLAGRPYSLAEPVTPAESEHDGASQARQAEGRARGLISKGETRAPLSIA